MAEQTSPAASQEPVTQQDAITPEFTPGQGRPQPESQSEATPLTPEQIAVIERIADQRAAAIANSQVQRGEARIQKLIQEKFKALEATAPTLGLSKDQIDQAKQKIVTEAYGSSETTQTNQPAPSQADNDQAIQFMNAQIGIVFKEVGTSVTKSDPEFTALQRVIDESFTDEDGLAKILLAAQRAASTKAARLQTHTENAAGRVIGGGQPTGGQAPRPTSAHSAWSEAYKNK